MKKILFIITLITTGLVILKITAEKNTNHKPQNKSVYTTQDSLKPHDLDGISQDQIDQHWELYKGYIAQVNQIKSDLDAMQRSGQGNSAAYADRRRRYGFEYNGMVLHEYYFQNLKNSSSKKPSAELQQAISNHFGSFEQWQDDFKNTGKTRGIGWALLVVDPVTQNLINIFVDDHEIGTITGFIPLIVMDVWEHAYMIDHKATERSAYIDAFMNNIDWDIVDKRFKKASASELFSRN